MARKNVVPVLAVEVVVEELFLHCARAFNRSRLWDVATWPAKRDVPSAGLLAKSISGTDVEAKVIDDALEAAALDAY